MRSIHPTRWLRLLTIAAIASSGALARAQPGTYPFYMPAPKPPLGPDLWSPLRQLPASVPECEDQPEVKEWDTIEPFRRWLVARPLGALLPGWSEDSRPAEILSAHDGSRLLWLEETYYSDPPSIPGAYEPLASGCAPLSPPPPWMQQMPHVRAGFYCRSVREYVLMASHTDRLVLKARIPAGPNGELNCTALRMMASLLPVHRGASACRGECTWFGDLFYGRSDMNAFEVEVRAIHGRVRRMVEVVRVGRPRFEVDIDFVPIRTRLPGNDELTTSIRFLGRQWPAQENREMGLIQRFAFADLYRPDGVTLESELGVRVFGAPSAFERGLRFAAAIEAAGEMKRRRLERWDRRAPLTTGEEDEEEENARDRMHRIIAAAAVALIALLLYLSARRVTRRS